MNTLSVRGLGIFWVTSLLLGGPIAWAEDPLTALDWLPGCWEAEGGEVGSGEMWMRAAGGSMFGLSRTIKGGKVVAHELMQLRLGPDGRLVFVARPSGQKEATFPLKSLQDRTAVFEDLGHDFPQRISYRPVGRDRLLARIEGLQDGKLVGIDFPMRRVRCEVAK